VESGLESLVLSRSGSEHLGLAFAGMDVRAAKHEFLVLPAVNHSFSAPP
jgi:hypothetical protein